MEDNTLAHRYRQYKDGTAKIVNWLVNTGRNCQDATQIIPALETTGQSSKPRRKNKKAAETRETTLPVTASQLSTLTKVIVEASVPIPANIINTIQTVIHGRQTCAGWYATLASSTDSRVAEQGHQHFITVLQEIQRLLTSSHTTKAVARTSKKRQEQTTPGEKSKARESLANTFSYLQVDEPLEDPLGTSSRPQRTNDKVHFELQYPEEDEMLFAVWCLFCDLQDLRLEARKVWTEHKAGQASFATAAMAPSLRFI